ncbi:hypothetical protein [Phycicoccus avicenniae]|uniref:hypothetical protein n=1 Tax=Phycicoccus avicenniae TaxID=2828860 RepID=UPI003D28F010
MGRAEQHRFRLTTPGRRVMRAPRPDDVLGVLESLPRDGHAVLQSMDDAEVYIQVWLRPDGTYQLELRDGSVETHRQALSVSRDRVAAAFSAWLDEHSGDGDDSWRAPHDWRDISATFTEPPA